MKKRNRLAFTLAMGVVVGCVSVFANAGGASVQPAVAEPSMDGLKEIFNQLPSDQQEKLMDAVMSNDLSDLGIDSRDLGGLNPKELLSKRF